ncbi:MAG: hypothetical protein RLZZ400_197, partial [Actinomycetota bacterium]
MHISSEETVALREAIFDYTRERMSLDPAPLDAPLTLQELQRLAPNSVNEQGL